MLHLFIEIVLWFVAISYGIALWQSLSKLVKRYPLFKAIGVIGLIAVLACHHNFLQAITQSPNYQIKLIVWILVIRIPFDSILWLLSNNTDTENNANKISAGYLGQQPYLGLRSANKPIVNGIASLKINKAFIWAFLIMLFSGNWMSHHLIFSTVLLSSFYLFKISINRFKILKIC
jgi:hypothetical protein